MTVLLVGVGMAAAGCLGPHPAGAHDRCAIERLAVPPGHRPPSAVTAGDRTGRFLVGRASPGGPVLLWDNGKLTGVPMLGVDEELTGVNAGGVAVGHARGSDGVAFSFTYHDGATTRMNGQGSVAVALNDRGAAAGYAGTRPVWWRAPDAEPEPLALPGNDWRGEALAIGDDGVIVGRVWPPAPSTQSTAYVWFPDGSHRELPGAEVAVAYRNGWAVGRTSGPTASSVRWNLREPGAALTVPHLSANVINASGSIAGAGPPMLATGTLGGTDAEVVALSDDGRRLAGTVIEASDADGQVVRVAVRWRCGT